MSREDWGTKTLLQTNSITTGMFRSSHCLVLAVPQRQNLLCVFVRFSFTAHVQQPQEEGNTWMGKVASPSALPLKILWERQGK